MPSPLSSHLSCRLKDILMGMLICLSDQVRSLGGKALIWHPRVKWYMVGDLCVRNLHAGGKSGMLKYVCLWSLLGASD